jgi:hypothetical protein
MPGDFTDKLMGGNGQKSVVPIGSKHYEMAGIGFYMNQEPKEILGAVVRSIVQQLQQAGEYGAAKQMLDNPQPFYGQPAALAVFMATVQELEQRDARIAELEKKVEQLLKETDSLVETP